LAVQQIDVLRISQFLTDISSVKGSSDRPTPKKSNQQLFLSLMVNQISPSDTTEQTIFHITIVFTIYSLLIAFL